MKLDSILAFLERILGLNGIVPEGWKSAIAGFVGAVIGFLVKIGVDVPEWVLSLEATIGLLLYIIAGLILKFTRPGRKLRAR